MVCFKPVTSQLGENTTPTYPMTQSKILLRDVVHHNIALLYPHLLFVLQHSADHQIHIGDLQIYPSNLEPPEVCPGTLWCDDERVCRARARAPAGAVSGRSRMYPTARDARMSLIGNSDFNGLTKKEHLNRKPWIFP